MNRTGDPFISSRDGGRSISSASTTSTTLIPTSDAGGSGAGPARVPMPAAIPEGPLRVTTLSTTSWRPQYPLIGQFAMTPSQEVVAASPDGLVYFMRVKDHPSKPWSEPRPFPPTTARLNASTVTGLALHQDNEDSLHVYCVADGVLHAFSRSGNSGSSFVVDPSPPLAGSRVSGTPAVAGFEARYDDPAWCVIAPCQFGGMLSTSTRPSQGWEPTKQIAAHTGIVSAVSVVVTHRTSYSGYRIDIPTDIVAVCIASARLYSMGVAVRRASRPQKTHLAESEVHEDSASRRGDWQPRAPQQTEGRDA